MDHVPDDLTKMLLESSFKESAAFWTRNTGYLTFHGIMLGFTANIIKTDKHDVVLLLGLCGIGFVVALLHFLTLRVSAHYNKSWYRHLESWVEKRAAQKGEAEWKHLHEALVCNEKKLPFPKMHSTSIAKVAPLVMMLSWAALAGYLIYAK